MTVGCYKLRRWLYRCEQPLPAGAIHRKQENDQTCSTPQRLRKLRLRLTAESKIQSIPYSAAITWTTQASLSH
jgi:hypothetical protein